MSEYWVSKKQYFCQYCKIFIRDDAPSRRQHETGLRHQGNKDRFLRDIYKTGEKAVKEKAEEKKIMAQIDKQAAIAHASSGYTASSMSAGPSAASSSSSATIAPKPRLAAGKLANTDKYANYSTAADLGFVDADSLLSDHAKLERDERAKVGQAGTWETVAVITPGEEIPFEDGQGGEPDARYAFNAGEDSKHHLGLLRGSLDDDPSEEARSFRFETDRPLGDDAPDRPRRVKLDVYDDGEWDPDSILGLGKRKKSAAGGGKDEASDANAGSGSDLVKGEEVKWQRGRLDEKKVVLGATREVGEVASPIVEGVKEEENAGVGDVDEAIKVEEPAQEGKPSTGSMFKKRKAPGAANRSVRQKM